MLASVLAVMKDPGGIQAVMPVVEILRQLGMKVLLVANGKAAEVLPGQEEGVMIYNTSEEALERINPFPDLLITSICTGGGIGRDLVPLVRQRHPQAKVVAIQDSWSGGLFKEWNDLRYRPDFIFVNDDVGANLVKKAWPDFDSDRIKTLGYALLDQYASIDQVAIQKSARKKLGLSGDKPVILYCGQTVASGQTLYELIQSINDIQHHCYLMPRQHPRMATDAAPIETEYWHKAEYTATYPLLISSTICTATEAIVASDLVTGMFSTMLMEAACLQKPVVSIMYPELGQSWFETISSGRETKYPLESLGACSTTRNPKQLRKVLEVFFRDGTLHQELAQKNAFRLDGKNAERIAEFVYSLV